MINKNDVIKFFDMYAADWDAQMVRDDKIIGTILDNAGIRAGSRVLDVACGTGVLIPDYLARGVESVTAIDISPEMVKIAQGKFNQPNVRIMCGDVMVADIGGDYDAIVIYNAFPHFAEPEKLVEILSDKLKKGGRFTVAHGMSRERIDAHHKGAASKVSNGLMEAEKLAEIFNRYINTVQIISDDKIYQVVGER